MDRKISAMRNLGPTMAANLASIGVHTSADLQRIGAVETFNRLRLIQGRQISRIALHAMFAALVDCDWRALPADIKAQLDQEAGLAPKPRRRVG
ncbi:MAG: TfoX/Sxy family DNA transformation protein [Aquidulcibacter sp.]|uniref:TfoX/Sxy family DNA transformation protein n=1 Tax=Aquidulcibacter sp. TaxID=2052990 RepID=UPI0022CCF5FE|nr:TfoX/Sxy family DNA transformation protein [Aquidulcibacter sp.]MCZ8207263.1 TfoX/Sxy family DNA transformation protein [Aquidulcibacter sp.]